MPARSTTLPRSEPAKVRTLTLLKMKRAGERIACVTAYDYAAALAAEAAGIDVLLVGDSLGMVVLGYESTLPVTVDDMAHHARAVKRGLKRALLVVDMPFMSYQEGPELALNHAGQLMKSAGAEAVKMEGGAELAPTVKRLLRAGIPVMGHLGLTPQSVHALGGYRIQAREKAAAAKLLADAKALEKAGAFAVVLEGVPSALARRVSRALKAPTIGIGAGAACDGQVQVWQDLMAELPGKAPRHAKAYAQGWDARVAALRRYRDEVRGGQFPGPAQTPA
jgi:3-methyl-2-oxobutanoate hydroxymethyltransferase